MMACETVRLSTRSLHQLSHTGHEEGGIDQLDMPAESEVLLEGVTDIISGK